MSFFFFHLNNQRLDCKLFDSYKFALKNYTLCSAKIKANV